MNTGGGMAELEGKVAVVTGSGRGIGEQVAHRLSAAGARVSPESDYVHGQVLNVSGGLAVGMAG
jgi:phosphoglycerate dehydrogenase-like enzyme